eukprot:Pgem_evm1s5081
MFILKLIRIKLRKTKLPSFRLLCIISFILRIILVFYSIWFDSFSSVKYTDADYFVFSDAA